MGHSTQHADERDVLTSAITLLQLSSPGTRAHSGMPLRRFKALESFTGSSSTETYVQRAFTPSTVRG
jgi:hypothetical protein